jgi:hypothetical protein
MINHSLWFWVPHVRSSVHGPKTDFFKCFHSMREEFFLLLRSFARLIRRRRLHMINNQNLDRRFMRFEFQPKLLLDHGEDRRS